MISRRQGRRFSRRLPDGVAEASTAPAITILVPSGDPTIGVDSVTISGTYANAPAGADIRVSYADAEFDSEVGFHVITTLAGGVWSHTFTSVSEQEYLAKAVLRDSDDVTVATAANRDFTVDYYAVAITTPSGTPTINAPTYDLGGTVTNAPAGSTVEVSVSNSVPTVVFTDSIPVSGNDTWDSSMFGLTDETYTVSVELQDSGMSVLATATTQDFVVALPTIAITVPTGDPTVNFPTYAPSGTYTNLLSGGNLLITLGGAASATYEVASPAGGTWAVPGGTFTALPEGEYTVDASMRNSSDVVVATATQQTFDVVIPEVAITAPTGTPTVIVADYTVEGTHTDAPASSEVLVTATDSGDVLLDTQTAAVSGTGTWDVEFTGLPNDTITFEATLENSSDEVMATSATADLVVDVPAAGSPETLAGSLHYWVASEGIVLDGGEVDEWHDQISDNHFLAEDTNRPTVSSADADFNSKDALSFGRYTPDLAHGYLKLTRNFDHGAATTGVEVYFILKWGENVASSTNNSGFHTFANGLTTGNYTAAPWTDGRTYDRGSTNVRLTIATHKHDETQAYSYIARDGLVQLFKNGASLGSSTSSVSYNFLVDPTGDGEGRIGASYSNAITRYFYGKIAAIYVHDGTMSSSDRFALHGYFNTEFGLSLPTS